MGMRTHTMHVFLTKQRVTSEQTPPEEIAALAAEQSCSVFSRLFGAFDEKIHIVNRSSSASAPKHKRTFQATCKPTVALKKSPADSVTTKLSNKV